MFGRLDSGGAGAFTEPLADRGFQPRRQSGHVVFDVQPFGPALDKDQLACHPNLLGQLKYTCRQ
jgi:hypothetical protein